MERPTVYIVWAGILLVSVHLSTPLPYASEAIQEGEPEGSKDVAESRCFPQNDLQDALALHIRLYKRLDDVEWEDKRQNVQLDLSLTKNSQQDSQLEALQQQDQLHTDSSNEQQQQIQQQQQQIQQHQELVQQLEQRFTDSSNEQQQQIQQQQQQIQQQEGVMDSLKNHNEQLEMKLTSMTAFVNGAVGDLQKLQDTVHRPKDCSDVKRYDAASGVHTLYVNDLDFTAYCDQTTDGGGWTVFVNRVDGSVDFNRTWQPYEDGFGDKDGEYWLGLRNLHALTSGSRQYELRVDIGDWDGSTAYAVYDVFRVDGPDVNYVLHVTGYRGTAGDSLYQPKDMREAANNMAFSTPDRDHDQNNNKHCASRNLSGWWMNNCYYALPTGQYNSAGPFWRGWKKDWTSYKTMSLKIRLHTRN